ncbi:MAG TPA: hypothetical protein VFU05_00975 [Cyclobacteriaceae bacterium]|nr:hypothetical protein [Cyclobacteriaceae bacterium]
MNVSQLIRKSIIVGLLATLPFMIMEAVNRWHESYNFPFVLFVTLWILASVFLATLFIIFNDVKSKRYPRGMWKLVLSSTIMVAALTVWLLIISDQMPCFLGVQKCD